MSRHSKVCMHPVVGPDVHCQWNIRHAFFRLLTRTWRSRPRPRPRTYLPRPRPRPRTCLTRPRPGPRTFILSSRTHQGQGQGLTTLGISVLLHRGSKCLLLQQMLCSITSPCQSAATFKTVNRCCSPVYSCKQRYSKYSEFYLYHCNFKGLLPFINRLSRQRQFIASTWYVHCQWHRVSDHCMWMLRSVSIYCLSVMWTA